MNQRRGEGIGRSGRKRRERRRKNGKEKGD